MKPVLFVTNHVPFDRVGAFEALARRVQLDVVTYGGRLQHGAAPSTHGRPVAEREVRGLAAGGGYSAVICGTGGRIALPGAYAGARRAGVPIVLWASLWAHPRTAAHTVSYMPLQRIYRGADAVVTYGEHVSAYVRAHGARNVHIAPQAVDNAFWAEPSGEPPGGFSALFVGRADEPGKGLDVLKRAWDGDGTLEILTAGATPREVRNFYAAAHVLVVPSVRTRTFREPWGLAINEAMNQRTAIIASDEVGAVAGGLVRHERNGLVFPAGDVGALARTISRLRSDRALRDRLADNGIRDVAAYTHEAWAAGFEAALRQVSDC